MHRLIHATNPDIIKKYMETFKLDQKQKEKLNKLRSLIHVESYWDEIKSVPDGKPGELKGSRPV